MATEGGDLIREIEAGGAGLVVPAGDPAALASALLSLAREPERLFSLGRAARALWERRWTHGATTGPLEDWARDPARWPASALDAGGPASLEAQFVRLQADLDAIRGSRTFRALRLIDRLLGRGPAGP